MKSFIAAVMIMGGREEPYLAPCLESIKNAVDLLVLNDNSGEASSVNMETVRKSALHALGKVRVIPSEFRGFGYCRTLCLDYLRDHCQSDTWVLYLDSDEVHPPSITAVTRKILPAVPARTGIVDGYFYNFYQSPRYYLSLDRRHNLFFRFNREIRWIGDVHEKPVNLQGRRDALPYCYYHYGYLKKPADLVERWKLYGNLGDEQSGGSVKESSIDYSVDAARSLPFRGRHPEVAVPYLDAMATLNAAHIEFYENLVREKTRWGGLDKMLKSANFEMRIAFRALQAGIPSLLNGRMREGFMEMIRMGC